MHKNLLEISGTYLKNINVMANKFIAKVLSISFVCGSLLYLVSQYIFEGVSISKALSFSLFLIFLSVLVQIVINLNLNTKIITHLLSLIIFFSLPIIILQFVQFASVTIWALPFILIIIALSFTSNIMIIYTVISGLLTQIYIWLVKPSALVNIYASDYIVRIGLVLLAGSIAIAVNNIYVARIENNSKYVKYIQTLAYHDHLTGLANRLFLFKKMESELAEAKEKGTFIALFYLDLDYFKMVNETIGHSYGDELLKKVGAHLKEIIGHNYLVSRVGGDEFVIMSPNIKDLGEVHKIADKITNCFVKPSRLNNQDFYITASIGVSLYPDDGDDPETILKNAHVAMHQAKKRGRNQYIMCTPSLRALLEENLRLTNYLYTALENDEFLLHYQPQVDIRSDKITGFEALLRWNHPELGFIPPGKFIPLAEQTALIRHIGIWVLKTACAQTKAWQDKGLPPVKIAVNLSLAQLENPNLVQQVSEVLTETQLDSSYLELEITENMAMKETDYVVNVLKDFKKLGITITIDDFGTDFSSLNFLKQLPIDKMKIAMPFVHGMLNNPTDEAIINMIIMLSQGLNLDLIAEGVETHEQLLFLAARDCHQVQGYYFFKPLPVLEAEKVLLEMKN
ncbi:diguanylate cyclase (GGDEF) domain-containing protein [Desulfonispora thiosulfatigenes DSM 11270]|uniref:Diguanylate cyclase (GGDEF) domain-containing protein n=1 Tax=Desulfonispora thiosulfatigenes DSM 11270 TaxID=656914 RepID=A0A1W1V3H9_DESTI|nr:EAL domain-containing protein [Desulfonispora thiosulfatigenes]SMB87843.1 diguanylate cyclase (GGDEF) domain-containing protein [Desulfonispora thiosulfatigenes DSM 11270]